MKLTAEELKLGAKEITLTAYSLELFAYHMSAIYRDVGKFGLSRPDGAHVDVEITPSGISNSDGERDSIWDSVVMDGHSVGNRHGGAKAYARFTAGEKEWWRAR